MALAFAVPAGAEQNPAKIAITPQSNRAAIMFRSPVLPVPASLRSAYHLDLQIYDPVNQRMEGGYPGGAVSIGAIPRLMVGGYVFMDLKPGTYAITDFSRQDWWILCFQDASLQFTVAAGEIVYLGAFNAAKALVEVIGKAQSSGRISTRGAPVDFFDNVAPPEFAPIDAADLAAAAASAKLSMPLTTVAPRAVVFAPARFGTGSTLFGGRHCGGYFPVKAK